MKNKIGKIVLIISVIVAVALIITLVLLQLPSKDENKYRTGQVEMTQYNISSKIPGRIEWIKVDEGDVVTVGQELFKLTDTEVKAKVAQAQGALYSANAQLELVKAGSRAEQIEILQRNYNAAKSQFELAEKTYNRMKNLYNDSLISAQEFDAIVQKYDAAKSLSEAAEQQLKMAKTGARPQEKEMAYGQYERALNTVSEAQAYLDESTVTSYWNGIIAKRYAKIGELVATGYPVLALIDTTDAWVELNLPATELQVLKIGDIVEGFIHGIGKAYKFKVQNFSNMADYANWRAQSDRATFEVRSFTIKLKPMEIIPSLRPGMTVTFDLNSLKSIKNIVEK